MRAVTLLDGGMGQELFHRSGRKASPLFSAQAMLDDPDMVFELHGDFIRAGADVICLNTYAATPERLERDADISLLEPIQLAAVQIAQKAKTETGRDVRIAGCLPPLVASYHAELVPPEGQAVTSYQRIVELQNLGVDLFIAETMSCVAEAHYVCQAVAETGKPIWVSFTVDDGDGTVLRSGETLMAGVDAAIEGNAAGILVNCSTPEAVGHSIAVLATQHLPFGGMANGFVAAAALQAGGTVDTLPTRKDLGPAEYASHVLDWINQGASLVGGCCEVSPAHIAAIRHMLDQRA